MPLTKRQKCTLEVMQEHLPKEVVNFKRGVAHRQWKLKRKRSTKKVIKTLNSHYDFYVYPYNPNLRYTSAKDIGFSFFNEDDLIAKRIDNGELVSIRVSITKGSVRESKLTERDKEIITKQLEKKVDKKWLKKRG